MYVGRRKIIPIALSAIAVLQACGGSQSSTTIAGGDNAATASSTVVHTTSFETGTTVSPAESVRIGALYQLTGPSAAAGQAALNGVNLAINIVNEQHPEMTALPLAVEAGLPNLSGALIEVIPADHEGDPATGASETERLITDEEVVALVGAYFSSVTHAASERAEQLRVPFVTGASSSTALTESRDLAFFFRTGPSDLTFGQTFFDFLDDLQSEKNVPINSVSILHENTEYGTDAANITQQLIAGRGYTLNKVVSHGNDVGDVTPEAITLRDAGQDVIFVASYTPEAILFTKTFRQLDYTPNILAYGAGYADPAYYEAVGKDGDDLVVRSAWTLEAVVDRPVAVAVAELYEQEYGQPFDDNAARTFTAAITLAYAINEAGSTDAVAIRDALRAVDLPGEATIMPWDGVRFSDSGQNELARGVITQREDGEFKVVWPFSSNVTPLVWPATPYDQR